MFMRRGYMMTIKRDRRNKVPMMFVISVVFSRAVPEPYIQTNFFFHFTQHRFVRVFIKLDMAANADPNMIFFMLP